MNDTQAWELAAWDAVETAARIRNKDVSAAEVLEAAIVRGEAWKHLNAVVTPMHERARAKAAVATGPLAGVPTFFKDLVAVEGVRLAWGSGASGEYVPTRNAPAVKAMEAAGLVALGKSATPELGLIATTEPLSFGACRNPWDVARSSGGSSGGAAALVASGVVPLAHGSDGGGSIRIPAACCGLVGLKPTRGRFDMEASPLLPVNIAVEGVLSRTVRDTVAFWEAVEPQLGKRTLPPITVPEEKRALRIGVFVDSPIETTVHPEILAATERAAKQCEDLGHHVELIKCPYGRQAVDDFIKLWGFVAFTQVKFGWAAMTLGFEASQVEPWSREFSSVFTDDLSAAFIAIRRLRRFTQTWAEVMTKYDVVISPTLGELPPLLGHLKTDQPFDVVMPRLLSFTPFNALMNAAGAPAISLPLGRSTEGLPIGVQFAGAMGSEGVLLQLALELEAAHPWTLRAPVKAAQAGSSR